MKLNTDDIYITSVECGGDGTIFISDEGVIYTQCIVNFTTSYISSLIHNFNRTMYQVMYACGGNKANKLGLDGPAGWLLSGEDCIQGSVFND